MTTMRVAASSAPATSTEASPWAIDPRVVVRVLDGAGIVVLQGEDSSLLRGAVLKSVIELVDGTRTSDEIVETLDGAHAPERVLFSIHQLYKRGVIAPSSDPAASLEQAFWAELGSAAQPVRHRTIAVFATAGVPRDVLDVIADGLRDDADSVHVSRELSSFLADGADLRLVVAADYTDPVLEQINRSSLDAGVAWFLVRPDARDVWVGPFFRPGVTACWECLMNRRRTRRRIHLALAETDGSALTVPMLSTGRSAGLIGRIAALEVAKVLRGLIPAPAEDAPPGSSHILRVALSDWDVSHHVVVRRPQCPACGDPTATRNARVQLRPERAYADDRGGLRTARPEETYRRFRHHVSAISGAVAELEERPTGYDGVHVWSSGANLGLDPEDLLNLELSVRARSAGKGATSEQARTGALAEALERYSSARHGEEPVVRGSLRGLGARALHPNRLMLFSDDQLDDARDDDAQAGWFNRVPARFDEDAVLDWTAVWSLTEDCEVLLPTALCYYGSAGARESGTLSDSNGCAAGNTLTEAVLQGFLELVERDGVAMWWYNRVRRPAVDLGSFADPWIDDLVQEYASKGREVWAIDVTTDLGIPTFAAFARRTVGSPESLLMGFGAHLDPRIAIARALGEIGQMSTTDEHLADPAFMDVDEELVAWLRSATIENQPHFVPALDEPSWRLEDHPSLVGADLADDVSLCRERVERAGLSMLVLDQTRPDIGLPVARVMVPGLRPFWSRFAPGRLYDVPVSLGWLSRPKTRAELNPIPFFL
ncbi:MAG TPA: TOMM precursor leader peptide-binding protein [Plantibacter sp.]|uniref:TOMM precursor leader peptide-binding protein n=1 Tax=Plantibacter sp. TaxID=1871045 RepID=UPI002C6D19D4|nr:TOMM precursor leader peptide-binding protein [Plantibacter sp.]